MSNDEKYLYFPGLILGCGLIMFVCVLSDEFGGATSLSARWIHQSTMEVPNYSYGWSFLLAVVGFLTAEFSAVMCLTAFLNKFDSDVSIYST